MIHASDIPVDLDIALPSRIVFHSLRRDEDELLASGAASEFDLCNDQVNIVYIIVNGGQTIISIDISLLALSMKTSLRRYVRKRGFQ